MWSIRIESHTVHSNQRTCHTRVRPVSRCKDTSAYVSALMSRLQVHCHLSTDSESLMKLANCSSPRQTLNPLSKCPIPTRFSDKVSAAPFSIVAQINMTERQTQCLNTLTLSASDKFMADKCRRSVPSEHTNTRYDTILTDPIRSDPTPRHVPNLAKTPRGPWHFRVNARLPTTRCQLRVEQARSRKYSTIMYCWFSCTCEKLFQCQRIPHSTICRIERDSAVYQRWISDWQSTRQWPIWAASNHRIKCILNTGYLPTQNMIPSRSLGFPLSSSNPTQWIIRLYSWMLVSFFFFDLFTLTDTRRRSKDFGILISILRLDLWLLNCLGSASLEWKMIIMLLSEAEIANQREELNRIWFLAPSEWGFHFKSMGKWIFSWPVE